MNTLKHIATIAALLCSLSAQASLEYVNFSFQFGTSNLNVDDVRTRGFGWSATSELFLTRTYGALINYGNSTTSADNAVLSGREIRGIEVVNRYLQTGPFFFPFQSMRLAAGASFNAVERETRFADGESDSASANFAGPFFNISYTLPLQRMLLGAQYNYVNFSEYTQSDLFFMLGFAF